MKVLDRIISFVFSIIMLMVSIVLIMAGTRFIESQMIVDFMENKVFDKEMFAQSIFNPVTITGIVLLFGALKTTVFMLLFKVAAKGPIIVKTKNGEVQIAQETIMNTARSATMMFEGVRDVQVKVSKAKRGVVIKEYVQFYADTIIRDLIESIQKEVKEQITKTTGVIVYEVNVESKGIFAGKRPEPKEPTVVYDKITGRPKTVGVEEQNYGISELKTVEVPTEEVKSEEKIEEAVEENKAEDENKDVEVKE